MPKFQKRPGGGSKPGGKPSPIGPGKGKISKSKGKDAKKPGKPRKMTDLKDIRNKEKRQQVYVERKKEQEQAKREERMKRKKEREELGSKAPPLKVPKTLENTREADDTMVDVEDEEVRLDQATDQFADYFKGKAPKVLITTSKHPYGKVFDLIEDIQTMFPTAQYFKRGTYQIKQIVEFCKNKDFTDIMVIHERKKVPDSVMMIHLPDGPTAFFKLSGVVYSKQVHNRGSPSRHRPEVILNNFNTRLGLTVGRMFAALLPHDPQFRARQVVTFHNQRDFIFVRYHRYMFQDAKDVDLQELGPRFTLKLQWMQNGTYDATHGEYVWHHKTEMDTSRRRFFL